MVAYLPGGGRHGRGTGGNLAEWLGKVEQLNMTLAVLPPRRIADGPYRGGWVVSADNARGRLYFALTADAFGQLDRG